LTIIGIDAAGAVTAGPGYAAPGNVFACQFFDKAAAMDIPDMVYVRNCK